MTKNRFFIKFFEAENDNKKKTSTPTSSIVPRPRTFSNDMAAILVVITNRSVRNLDLAVKINFTYIKCTNSYKFLGINVDNRLKFNLHISDISCKISKSVGILFRLSSYLPSVSLLQIYISLVNSLLMYCNAIWGVLRVSILIL